MYVSSSGKTYLCKQCGKMVEEEKGEQKPPSLFTQAKNLTNTLADFASSGFKVTEKSEYELRMSDCRSCPFDLFNHNTERCMDCGCKMSVKAKMESATCPKGVWEARKNKQL